MKSKSYSLNSIREFVFLFLISTILPFLALFFSIIFRRHKWSKGLFVFFCCFFGYSFVIPVTNGEERYDSSHYEEVLKEYNVSQIPFDQFIDGLYTLETQQVDLYQPLVTWCVSRFTDSSNILFAVFGLFFGIFYGNILWFIFTKLDFKISISAFFLILLLMLINPIWNINGVRMWTATEVYVYGLILYFYDNKKLGLFFMVFSTLFHVSFFIPLLFFIVYLFLPNKSTKYLFIVYVISVFIASISVDFIGKISVFFPDAIRSKIDFYTNVEYGDLIKEKKESLTLFLRFIGLAFKIIPVLLILYVHSFHLNKIKGSLIDLKLYNYILFTFIWANVLSLVPSGGRFIYLAFILLLFFVIIKINDTRLNPAFNYLMLLLLPFICAYFWYSYRNFSVFQGLPLFFSNFFIPHSFFE